ncbi:MAG: zf-HC2 domain-containing protein [bacterium]|nr:zf-HC2 domain-containing protein [bacterium]
MRCARAQDRLMAYHDGELSAAGNRKMEKHLAACAGCARLLERLVRADQAAGTAGVPGADDGYWESFTSRVLDRVEEDVATRVPVSETRNRPLFQMALPRLVPAFSIALVVVVSAGVLLKIGRVAQVPKVPVVTYATGEMAVEKPSYREPEARPLIPPPAGPGTGRAVESAREVEKDRMKDDAAGLPGPEQESLRQGALEGSTPAPEDVPRVEQEKNGAVPVQRKMAVTELASERVAEPAFEALVEEIPSPEPAKVTQAGKDAPSDDLDTAAGSAFQAAKPVITPPVAAYSPQTEPEAGPAEVLLSKPLPEPSPASSPEAGERASGALPGTSDTITEAKDVPGAPAYSYRDPEEQLEHARRLAEVRKYWESEQILKDLISQNPRSPVYEEASILMVDVLSSQNRVVEARQFLDEAKRQFPASDLVQGYHLEPPPPASISPAPAQ